MGRHHRAAPVQARIAEDQLRIVNRLRKFQWIGHRAADFRQRFALEIAAAGGLVALADGRPDALRRLDPDLRFMPEHRRRRCRLSGRRDPGKQRQCHGTAHDGCGDEMTLSGHGHSP